jgi:hypothetical protein
VGERGLRGLLEAYHESTESRANLPTSVYWHKVLHQYFSASIRN